MSLPYISVVDHTKLNFIEKILCHFESCFSCKAAFHWFVTITIGLMLRSDKLVSPPLGQELPCPCR